MKKPHPHKDSDGDGFTDRDEVAAGTNPHDPRDFPKPPPPPPPSVCTGTSQTAVLGIEFVLSLVPAGDKLFASTGTSPAKVLRFNRPTEDLADFDVLDVGLDFGWDMIYVPERDRLYLATSFNEDDATDLYVTEINPHTLEMTRVVASVQGPYVSSFVPSLCSDGTNLWVSARVAATSQAAALCYRMSDWSLQRVEIIPRSSATLCRFDGSNVYLGGNIENGPEQAWIAKITENGHVIADLDSKQLEPDVAFVGGHMFAGMNDLSGNLYRIDTATMAWTKIPIGVPEYCFTVYYDGKDLLLGYRTAPGTIVRFDPNELQVRSVITLPEGENNPNEFAVINGHLFTSLWPESTENGYTPTAVKRLACYQSLLI